MSLENQVIIITGAGSGVGRAMALAMAGEGANVVAVARTAGDIELIAEEARTENLPGSILPIPTDVTDVEQVSNMVKRTLDVHPVIDVLINNAGSFYCLGPISEADPQKWLWDVNVNLYGSFLCSRAVLPSMIQRREGCILNLTGGGASNPLPFGSAYASSKCGLHRLTECLAAETKEHNIRVFIMSPGFVRSRMTEFHVFSEEGNKYLPTMKGQLDEKEYPPDAAVRTAIHLIKEAPIELTGRLVRGDTDFEALRESGELDNLAKSQAGLMRLMR